MRARPPRRCAATTVLAALLLSTGLAGADPREQAATRLNEGVAEYRAGNVDKALGLFQDAYALFPSDKILFNIGMALDRLGRAPEAAHAYDLYLTQASADAGARTAAARAALERLSASLGRLQFDVDVAGASITIDGRPVILSGQRRIYVTAGRHVVAAAAPGLVSRRVIIRVRAGELRPVVLDLAPPPAVIPPRVVASSPPAQAPPERPGRRRMWTWIAAGTAVAAGAGGVLAGLRADRAYDDYQSAVTLEDWEAGRDRVRRNSLIANGLFATAGVAAITSGVLFFVEGRRTGVAVSSSSDGGMRVWLHGSL